jgi:anti-sigma regulatory factor (Ser/Thr protein kinase)
VDSARPPPVSRADLELPAEPASAARARSFVAEMLVLWDCDDPDQLAVLLTSEVVTNAVRYASQPIRVAITADRTRIVVATTDDDPRTPQLRTARPEARGGRGLFLVEAIASRWGIVPHPPGKTVWFEIDLPPAAKPSQAGTGAARRSSPPPPRRSPRPDLPSKPATPPS